MIEKILEYITKRCIYIRMKLQTCVGYSQAEKNVRLEELYTIKQECERMRKYHNKCCEEFEKEKKEWLEKYNQVSRDFYSGKYCNAEKCQQLDQLKAENKDLQEQIRKHNDDMFKNPPEKRSYCKGCTLPYVSKKLKQTLTEIKEIIHFNKTNRLSGGACISIEQILQKISEVQNA